VLDQHASGTPGIHDERRAEKEIETQEEKNGAGGRGFVNRVPHICPPLTSISHLRLISICSCMCKEHLHKSVQWRINGKQS